MKCTEVNAKLAEQVKKAGIVDERGIMFKAGSEIVNNGKITWDWKDRVFALNGETMTLVAVEKGIFGEKLCKIELSKNLSLKKEQIVDGQIYPDNKNIYYITIHIFTRGEISNKIQVGFDVSEGSISVASKMLDALGLKA